MPFTGFPQRLENKNGRGKVMEHEKLLGSEMVMENQEMVMEKSWKNINFC